MAQQSQRDLQLRLRPIDRAVQRLERPRRAVVAALLQRAVEIGDVFLGRIAAGEEELLDGLVAAQEEEGAFGGLAVATGAARLLVVRVEPRRHLVVDDEARVGLVDAEAERVGRDHHARSPGHEIVLARLALGGGEPAVVEDGVERRLRAAPRALPRRPSPSRCRRGRRRRSSRPAPRRAAACRPRS